MSTISVLITALALAMDAMSLSIYQGIASTEAQKKQNFLKIVLTFGIFQFAMALVGSLSGTLFIHYISLYSKYVSFAIFLFLGLMMLKEALKNEEMEYEEKYLDFKTLKNCMQEDEKDLIENIRKIYFEIGIGDK